MTHCEDGAATTLPRRFPVAGSPSVQPTVGSRDRLSPAIGHQQTQNVRGVYWLEGGAIVYRDETTTAGHRGGKPRERIEAAPCCGVPRWLAGD